jgi:hypothetical protein
MRSLLVDVPGTRTGLTAAFQRGSRRTPDPPDQVPASLAPCPECAEVEMVEVTMP